MNIIRDEATADVVVVFEPIEVGIFTETVGLVGSLIDSAQHLDKHPELIDDAALARLLPAGYADDADAALEFSRFTRDELIEQKLDDSFRVMSSFEHFTSMTPIPEDLPTIVRITPDRILPWLRTITDLRLTLDARMNQDPATLAAPLDDDDIDHFRSVSDWLGMMQETIIGVMERGDDEALGRRR
ncbi:hypothetical protein GCM10027416_31670 [Okibacterium endophyticum]